MMKNIYFNLTTKGIAPSGLGFFHNANCCKGVCSYGAEFMLQILNKNLKKLP